MMDIFVDRIRLGVRLFYCSSQMTEERKRNETKFINKRGGKEEEGNAFAHSIEEFMSKYLTAL